MFVIAITNITKVFDKTIILKNFTLNIQDGEFVVFAGESGCGKTTLLNMIGALEEPDEGEILIDGENICKRKRKYLFYLYKVGFLFQNFALVEEKTVRQNLELIPKKARTQYTLEESLEYVGLSEKADIKIYKLSGGEQQRVAIARLMMKKCDIILADEPTGSLDEKNADIVMRLLHDLNDMGKTVIVVTHNEKIINSEKRVIHLFKE